MINAYSLAAETLEGTLDETYPVISKISDMKLRPQKMKLSDKTLTLLKNFSTINQSILFKKGNSLRTISVMKNGKIVENGNTKSILRSPKHIYTKELLKSVPRI